MQRGFTFKNGTLLEEILYAVMSVVHEEKKIWKHIQKSFRLSEAECLEAKETISKYYEEPSVHLVLKSIKLRNLLNLTDVGHEVSCLVRVDGSEIQTKEVSIALPEWDVNHEFVVQDLWESKLEIETWRDQEKEAKEPFTRVWLRSLDLFSKKFRSTLRSENLTALASIVSTEGNRVIVSRPKENGSNIMEESLKNRYQEEKEQKQESSQGSESNWVLNAFATLRKPNTVSSNSKKTPPSGGKRPAPQPGARGHLEMLSPIPIGRESLRDGWRTKSEKSFFSKYDPNKKSKVGSQPDEPGSKSDRKEREDMDIKAKSEVNVRRQLFPSSLDAPSIIIPEDAHPKPELKPISVFNPVYNFKMIPKIPVQDCGGDASGNLPTRDGIKMEEIPPRPRQNLSLRYGTLKISPRNEFQLWKRMSLTLRDKTGSLNSPESDKKASPHSLEGKKENRPTKETSERGNTARVGPFKEEMAAANRIRVKVGLSSTRLKDVFLKMNCSEWTSEEEAILVPLTSTEELGATRPSIVTLALLLRCESKPVPIPPWNVFFSCLKLFLTEEKSLEIKDGEDYGLCLPLTRDSKLILKSLAFVYNISEALIGLACWLALMQESPSSIGGGVDFAMNAATPSDTSDHNSLEDGVCPGRENEAVTESQAQKLKIPSGGGYRNVHAKFLFKWLTKVEAAASCSCYSEEEERCIAFSFQNFIDYVCQQFKRIHSSFPVNQSSHLAFCLKCVHLLSELESLQSIMKKANVEMGETWPKSSIMNAVKTHAENWTEALVNEIQSEKEKSLILVPSAAFRSEGGTGQPTAPADQPLKHTSNIFLMQAVMNGEKATLSINDFIVLGEKIYEANFQSELNESYLEVVWPAITAALVTLLSPVQSILQSSISKAILSTGLESLQDLHISLWILLLQLSKLQRFQNMREKESRPLCLPETFSETFFLLSCLWLDICLFRAKEMAHLECRTDDLNSSENDGLSSSARELVDFFVVIQEKLSRFAFPSDRKFKENLADFLEDGMKSVVETYKCHVCNLVLDKSPPNNTLNSHMCIAANNVERLTVEANNVVSCLSPLRKKEPDSLLQLRVHTKETCFFFFTKSLPRITFWITNALSSREKEDTASDCLFDWIKSAVDPVLDHSFKSSVLFRHFWDFLFDIAKEKLKRDSLPKDYRILGNFMEKVYFFYKITLGVELHSQSQNHFQNFMETAHLKGSSTTEVIQMYYAERYREQEALTTRRQPLVLNAYFCKDKSLKVEVFVTPYVSIATDKRRYVVYSSEERRQSDRSSHDHLPPLLFFKDPRVTSRVKQRASGVIEWLTQSSSLSFYAKVQLVPNSWFKVKEKKTRSTQRNPPVFEDQLSFNIKCTDEGVIKGGFLLVRLKYSSMALSGVESEALLPLRDIPLILSEDRRQNKHNFLKLSAPTGIQDYNTLMELASRKQDKEACSFLAHLHQSFWVRRQISMT